MTTTSWQRKKKADRLQENLRDSIFQTAEGVLKEKPENPRNHWFDK